MDLENQGATEDGRVDALSSQHRGHLEKGWCCTEKLANTQDGDVKKRDRLGMLTVPEGSALG
jgi:hypothetical protein